MAYVSHGIAGREMKKAAEFMLLASQNTSEFASKGTAERYRKIAYKMKRLTKEWNRLEQERELK